MAARHLRERFGEHLDAGPFADARPRWLAGLCPCCGWPGDEAADGTASEPIGEGVLICGSCVARGHLDPPVPEAILLALLP